MSDDLRVFGDAALPLRGLRGYLAWGKKAGYWFVLVLYVTVILVLWQSARGVFDIPPYLLPTPTEIARVLWTEYIFFFSHLRVTLAQTLIGFSIAAVLGVVLAISIVAFGILRRTLYPSLVAFNAVPKVALAPLLVIWFGVGMSSKVAMSFLIAFFPVLINTMAGLHQVSPELLELMRSLHASRRRVFYEIRIPNAIPYMFDGFRIAVPLAVIGTIVGEFVGSRAGLGFILLSAQSALNTSAAFAVLVWITAMSVVLFGLVGLARRWATPWERSSE